MENDKRKKTPRMSRPEQKKERKKRLAITIDAIINQHEDAHWTGSMGLERSAATLTFTSGQPHVTLLRYRAGTQEKGASTTNCSK